MTSLYLAERCNYVNEELAKVFLPLAIGQDREKALAYASSLGDKDYSGIRAPGRVSRLELVEDAKAPFTAKTHTLFLVPDKDWDSDFSSIITLPFTMAATTREKANELAAALYDRRSIPRQYQDKSTSLNILGR